MSAKEIKDEVERGWRETPFVDVCVRIIDFIDALPEEERQLLTYGTFVKALERRSLDLEIVTAVSILSATRIAALDVCGIFTDEAGEEYELNPKEFADARRVGQLVHPDTGEIVRDIDEYICPFFVPTERLKR